MADPNSINIQYTNAVAFGGEVPLGTAGEHLTSFKDLEEWLGRDGQMGIKNAIAEIGYVGRAYGIVYNDTPGKLINEAVYAVNKIEESRTTEAEIDNSKQNEANKKQAEELINHKEEVKERDKPSIFEGLAEGGKDPFIIPNTEAANDQSFNTEKPIIRMTGIDSIEEVGKKITKAVGDLAIENIDKPAIELVPNTMKAANDKSFKISVNSRV